MGVDSRVVIDHHGARWCSMMMPMTVTIIIISTTVNKRRERRKGHIISGDVLHDNVKGVTTPYLTESSMCIITGYILSDQLGGVRFTTLYLTQSIITGYILSDQLGGSGSLHSTWHYYPRPLELIAVHPGPRSRSVFL